MKQVTMETNRRILVIDDNPSIHSDFRKILAPQDEKPGDLAAVESALFGAEPEPKHSSARFDLDSAYQGQEGIEKLAVAIKEGRPFALAFVDVRMPPGMDGIETAARLWEIDPDLHIVICTAYTDYSWDEMMARLKVSDRLVILKKPFDVIEVLQLANALTAKWTLQQQARLRLQDLEELVQERTRNLEEINSRLARTIEDERRTAGELRATQEKLGHFLSHSPAVLYSLRAEGDEFVPEWISENFASFAGCAVEDWMRQRDGLLHVHEEDREAVREARLSIRDRERGGVEFRLRLKDGGVRWVRDDLRAVRRTEDGAGGIIGCWTDITDRRELESQLRQAQKMESVGQLAGGVAHDFNNLLMVILGHVDLARMSGSVSEEMSGVLGKIRAATERASNLTRQLLAFGRRQIMQPKALDVNALVNDMTHLLNRTLGEHIEIKTQFAPELPAVIADRGMIEQVLMNLVVNARDAMPDGGQLTLSTELRTVEASANPSRADMRPGRFVVLNVSDTGSGIRDEHMAKLFEPFFTTKEVGKGSGLGLATAYGIVRQHDGWIEVESRRSDGTVFRVHLPANGKAEADAPSAVPSPRSETPDGRETVLVVEDEKALRKLLAMTLKRRGYTVHVCVSGEEVLRAWADRLDEIDLLITDIVMPDGVSGWELAKEFQLRKPGLKVIYMSGYNAEMTTRKLVFDNRVRFLQKPFGIQQLAEVMRDYLDGETKLLSRADATARQGGTSGSALAERRIGQESGAAMS